MIPATIFFRHLCFTGPEKDEAILNFERGLNVLYGSSDTGKSFVLEAIDFMLGGRDLKDIPERGGYDRIFLGIETISGDSFTLMRPASGGALLLFPGLHKELPKDIQPVKLSAKHSADSLASVSSFLLDKIGLYKKEIRKNADGDTVSLSIRDLRRFVMIPEGDIQKQGSPIETGQVIFKTKEYSIFKLLLTGGDDSACTQSTQKIKLIHLTLQS